MNGFGRFGHKGGVWLGVEGCSVQKLSQTASLAWAMDAGRALCFTALAPCCLLPWGVPVVSTGLLSDKALL